MDLLTTRRYPSLAMAAVDGVSSVSVDGLEVIDEQVVALAPLDEANRTTRSRRPRERAW